jgi:hypothetical protein
MPLVVLGAAALFATTVSSHVALGDAPESVAGVKTLSVLHAPGYPAYVLAARAFTSIVPFGSWALQVNLFSLVCASLTVGIVYLIARRLGAGVTGAVIGAFALATTVSFWFNAGFAKHYPFSALLLAGALFGALEWERTGRAVALFGSAAALGICIGASWELGAIMAASIAVLLAIGGRRPALAEAIAAVAVAAVLGAALLVFVLVRARQDPTLNWGDANSLSRLVDLVTQRDFKLGSAETPIGAGVIGRVPERTAVYSGVVARDLGLGALVLAIVGAFAAVRRAGRARAIVLAVVGITNLVATIVAAGLEEISGFDSGLTVGGFLLNTYFVLALLAALGASELIDAALEWARSRPAWMRAYRLSTARVFAAATFVIVAVALVPSALVHQRYASHRVPPFADRYARHVLAALPREAVLVVGGYGYGLPVRYRQIVAGERRDVTVIDGLETTRPWYREQLTRRLGLGDTMRPGPGYEPLQRLVAHLRATRPVYLDTTAMGLFRDAIGYRARGFVGEMVDGTRHNPGSDLDAVADELERADREIGVDTRAHGRFPNLTIYVFHERAHIELAKQYLLEDRLDAVDRELQRALDVLPLDTQLRGALELLRRGDPQARDYIATQL